MEIFLQGITLDELVSKIRLALLKDEKREEPFPKIGGLELAEKITGLSRPTLYRLTSTREIPHSKKGRKLYFRSADLEAWINSGERKVKSLSK